MQGMLSTHNLPSRRTLLSFALLFLFYLQSTDARPLFSRLSSGIFCHCLCSSIQHTIMTIDQSTLNSASLYSSHDKWAAAGSER